MARKKAKRKVRRKAVRSKTGALDRLERLVERLEAVLGRLEVPEAGDRPTVVAGSFCPSCGTEEKDNPLRVPEMPCDDPWHRVREVREVPA